MSVLQPVKKSFSTLGQKYFSSSSCLGADQHFRLVVVGGGSGGCATAAKFSRKLGTGKVAVIDPATMHYYQPMWTLVGGGLKTLEQSGKSMESVLPSSATWIKEKVTGFQPEENYVTTESGDKISYDFLVVAAGLQLRYDKIKGLPEAFETPGVCSNYSPLYVEKTTKAIREFKAGGDAVFTLPNSPIKCAGAPQKILYIAEETFRLQGKPANMVYYTALPVIFGVKKYADALWKVVKERGINVNLRHDLIEVKPDTREAIFLNLDTQEKVVQHYDLLHVTPYMNAAPVVRDCKELSNSEGYLEIDKFTLQHVRYPNVFGLGDCTNLPTSKTAAAVAGQFGVLRKNLGAVLDGKPMKGVYDGYTSCPLVTGKNSCILAEFDFSAPPKPLETFPVNQAKERSSMYLMKAHAMPFLYWQGMLRGFWEGPAIFRKAMRLGMSK